jgi:hypothetical protein
MDGEECSSNGSSSADWRKLVPGTCVRMRQSSVSEVERM